MKKYLLTALFSLLALGIQAEAENELRWGISLGSGAITFESDQTDSDTSDYYSSEADYNPTIFGFDVSNGTHSVSFINTSSGSEDLDTSSSTTSDYNTLSAERDYDEMSITYLYRINNSWSVGLGYNKISNDSSRVRAASWDYFDSWQSWTNATDPGQYTFTRTLENESEMDGLTLLATWVKPIESSPNWVFAAKMGLADTEYSNSFSGTNVLSGVPVDLNTYLIDYGYGNANGDGWDWSGTETGDNIAAVFGLTMVYIVNPQNTISFNYDTRVDDFGELTADYVETPRGGWVTAEDEELQGTETYNNIEIEQTNWKFTIVWRFALN